VQYIGAQAEIRDRKGMLILTAERYRNLYLIKTYNEYVRETERERDHALVAAENEGENEEEESEYSELDWDGRASADEYENEKERTQHEVSISSCTLKTEAKSERQLEF